jgi:asparaginyl-tRNA synthetase
MAPQGELIGGSAREERWEVLRAAMVAAGVYDSEAVDKGLNWYLDLRKHGGVPTGGWGMGFERLVQYVTGLENIRDAIPIPRVPDGCKM